MFQLLRARLASRSDAGVTLIETLVALSILSIAGVAVMAGLQLSVQASDIHRKQATGGAYVRSYAEAIEKYLNTVGHYKPCAAADDYNVSAVTDELSTLPSAYKIEHSAATPLDGGGNAITTGSCPSRDQGVQRLTLTVASTDGRATERLTIVVRKACGAGTSCS
jgi:prepilin-type N-terminal cleavage/methylation domain-containing protein